MSARTAPPLGPKTRGSRRRWARLLPCLLLTALVAGRSAAAPPVAAATGQPPTAVPGTAADRAHAAAPTGQAVARGAEPPAGEAPRHRLEEEVWQLDAYRTSIGLRPAVSGEGSGYVVFEQGGFRINAGCDTLRGSYLLEEDRLLFSPHIASTLGDCPATLRAQEQAVLALLPTVAGLREEADGLALLDAQGRPALTLKAPEKAPLQRRLWRLLAYRNRDDVIVAALPAPRFTLRFDDAVRLSGEACDEYRGAFVRDARYLRLEGPLAGTKLGCRNAPAASRQAEDYLRMLGLVDSYRVDAQSLLLRDADGRMLARFAASAPQPDEPAERAEGFADSAPGPRPAPLPAPSAPR